MAEQYDNEMRGVLFKHDKQGNEKAPDYKGTCQIKGVEYDMAAWIRTSKKGQKFMSFSFEDKRERQQQQQTGGAAPAPVAENFGMPPGTDPDDIPF